MKKILAILILTAACTTLSSPQNGTKAEDGSDEGGRGAANPARRNEIDGLEDIAYEYVESTWGKPDTTTSESSGAKVAIFKNIHTTAEDPDSDKPIHKLCDIELKVDAEGTVVDWDYKSCKMDK